MSVWSRSLCTMYKQNWISIIVNINLHISHQTSQYSFSRLYTVCSFLQVLASVSLRMDFICLLLVNTSIETWEHQLVPVLSLFSHLHHQTNLYRFLLCLHYNCYLDVWCVIKLRVKFVLIWLWTIMLLLVVVVHVT